MKKRVIFTFMILVCLAGFASAKYYPNMNTDDPDCTAFLPDDAKYCKNGAVSFLGIEVDVTDNGGVCSLDYCGEIGRYPDFTCDCNMGNCCEKDVDKDKDGVNNWWFGGEDCDDSRSGINPSAKEVCGNGFDDDCDGKVDCEDEDCQSDISCFDVERTDVNIAPKPGVCGDETMFNKVQTSYSLTPFPYSVPAGSLFNGCLDENAAGMKNKFVYCLKEGDFWNNARPYVYFGLNLIFAKGGGLRFTGGGLYADEDYPASARTIPYFWIGAICSNEDAGGLCGGIDYCEEGIKKEITGKREINFDIPLNGCDSYPIDAGSVLINLLFRDYVDVNADGIVDFCQTCEVVGNCEEKGCSIYDMKKILRVELPSGEIKTLKLNTDTVTKQRFAYEYDDEKVSITLNYYFNHPRPGKKFRTSVFISDKSTSNVPLYMNLFDGHIGKGDYNVAEGRIAENEFIEKEDGGGITFKLLDDPCSDSSLELVLEEEPGILESKTPVSKNMLEKKDLDKIAEGEERYVYVKTGEGKVGCLKVSLLPMPDSPYSGITLKNTFCDSGGLYVPPVEITPIGGESNPKIQIIKAAEKETAITFDTEEKCRKWTSYVLKDEKENKNYPVPGMMFTQQDVEYLKGSPLYVEMKFGDEPVKCAQVSESICKFDGSCGTALKNNQESGTNSWEAGVRYPLIGTSEQFCKDFSIGKEFLSRNQKELQTGLEDTSKEEREQRIKEFNNMLTSGDLSSSDGITKKKFQESVAKTYKTKQECEKPKVFINWYPGLHLLFGLIPVDRYESTSLFNNAEAYIKKNYAGDVLERRTITGYAHDMDMYVKKNLYFGSSLQGKQSASISFGWSEGGRNAFRNVWETYFELKKIYAGREMPPIVLGMFRFEPTHSSTREFIEQKQVYSIKSDTDLPPVEILPYYVNVFAKQGTGVAGVANANDREILIDFSRRNIQLSKGHFGVSQPIIKALLRIYIDCLVNKKTKQECEGFMNQAIQEMNSEDVLKRNYLTGEMLSEAELSEFSEYEQVAFDLSIQDISRGIVSAGFENLNEENKEAEIQSVLIAANKIINFPEISDEDLEQLNQQAIGGV